MNLEQLEEKRNQIHQALLDYQTQVIACQGALKVLDDLIGEINNRVLSEEKDNPGTDEKGG